MCCIDKSWHTCGNTFLVHCISKVITYLYNEQGTFSSLPCHCEWCISGTSFWLTHYSVSAFLQLIAAYGYNDAFQLIFAVINNAGSISWTADLKFWHNLTYSWIKDVKYHTWLNARVWPLSVSCNCTLHRDRGVHMQIPLAYLNIFFTNCLREFVKRSKPLPCLIIFLILIPFLLLMNRYCCKEINY